MTLDQIKVGQFVLYVLGGGPRVAQVVELVNSRWPQVGLKPWLPGRRKADQIGLSTVIFAGTVDEANAALGNYRAIRSHPQPSAACGSQRSSGPKHA